MAAGIDLCHPEPIGNTGNLEACRQKFLAALSISLSDEAFSWRRQQPSSLAEEAEMKSMASKRSGGVEAALEELRKRMEIACRSAPSEDARGCAATPTEEEEDEPEDEEESESGYRHEKDQDEGVDDEEEEEEDSSEAGRAAEAGRSMQQDGSKMEEPAERRQMFLNMLAQGYKEMPEVDLPSSCKAEPANAASAASSTPPPGHDMLGPQFFAGVEALQQRISQRRMSSKATATSRPSAASAAVPSFEPVYAASASSTAEAGQTAARPLSGASSAKGTAPSVAVQGGEERRAHAAKAEAAKTRSDRSGARSSSPPSFKALVAMQMASEGLASKHPVKANSSPLRESEQRRPKTGGSSSPSATFRDAEASPMMGSAAQASSRIPCNGTPASSAPLHEEHLQSDGDELLRWAEEVLRKAHCQASQTQTGGFSSPPIHPQPAAPARDKLRQETAPDPPNRRATMPPVPPPPLSPRSAARRRRAEELRDKMRRLTEESEMERERLSSHEEAQRQRIAQEEEQWRSRVNCAAEEFRSNLSKWSFSSGPPPPSPRQQQSHPGATSSSNSNGNAYDQQPCSGGKGDHQEAWSGEGVPSWRSGGRPWRPATDRQADAQPTHHHRHHRHHDESTVDEKGVSWASLEVLLDTEGSLIHFWDIPWPSMASSNSSSITGITRSDSAAAAKRKLAVALRKWHPDKWRRILDHVPLEEQQRVMERVKMVAQRLLEEKAKLAVPGGVLA